MKRLSILVLLLPVLGQKALSRELFKMSFELIDNRIIFFVR